MYRYGGKSISHTIWGTPLKYLFDNVCYLLSNIQVAIDIILRVGWGKAFKYGQAQCNVGITIFIMIRHWSDIKKPCYPTPHTMVGRTQAATISACSAEQSSLANTIPIQCGLYRKLRPAWCWSSVLTQKHPPENSEIQPSSNDKT